MVRGCKPRLGSLNTPTKTKNTENSAFCRDRQIVVGVALFALIKMTHLGSRKHQRRQKFFYLAIYNPSLH